MSNSKDIYNLASYCFLEKVPAGILFVRGLVLGKCEIASYAFLVNIRAILNFKKERDERMQHLAIIPDGNRRWAAEHRLEACFGHRKGLDAFETAITICLSNKIKYLSFYAFSLENFKRSEVEKNYLFSTLPHEFLKKLPELIEKGIKVQFLGDERFYPESLQTIIKEIQEKTRNLSNLTLSLLFCYGGRQELVFAVQNLAQQVLNGSLRPDEITEQTISDSLWTAGMPDPDLIIRTSGIVRLSNFLLYQAAYSEFKFLDCYWPEVTGHVLQECIDEFEGVKRNFGK